MFDCCSLEIKGGLLLFAKLTIQSGGSKPIKLTAHHIVIKWVIPHHSPIIFHCSNFGEFEAGSEKKPFQGDLEITLTGTTEVKR